MKWLKSINALLFVLFMLSSSCQEDVDPPFKAENQEDFLLSSARSSKKNPSVVNRLLADVRKATTQFHDVNAALAAGYVDTEQCVPGPPGEGAMGIHFINFDLIDDVFNPLEPEVLLYELRNNGTYKLTGVEYLFEGDEAPLFAGVEPFKPFHLPFADYALHVWIWKGNPNGIFEDFNVNVSCP